MKNVFFGGRILCIALYLACLIAWISAGAWWWLIIYAVLHLFEAVFFGIRIGSQYGKGIGYSTVMTMLFGVFWWYGLKLGYCE